MMGRAIDNRWRVFLGNRTRREKNAGVVRRKVSVLEEGERPLEQADGRSARPGAHSRWWRMVRNTTAATRHTVAIVRYRAHAGYRANA